MLSTEITVKRLFFFLFNIISFSIHCFVKIGKYK